jgi:DHA1 family multidrug resistance protein-like MFS transporter
MNLRAIWFAELVAIVGFTVVIPILPLYLRELNVQSERQVRIWSGVIFSAQSIMMALFGPIWGVLGDRYGRKIMVVRAMIAGAVIMTLMGFAQSPQQLALLRALQGAFTGTVTAATALVATSVPSRRAGYALGSLQTAVYIGASVGPLVGGFIADTFGYRAAFIVTGILLLIAAAGVFIFVSEPFQTDKALGVSTTSTNERSTIGQRVWNQLGPVMSSAPLLAVFGVRLVMRLASRLPTPTLPLFVETIAPPNTQVATMTGLISGANALGAAIGGHKLGQLGDRVGYRSILVICALGSALCYAPQSMVGGSTWLIPLQAGAGLAMGGILVSISASLAALAPQGREGIIYGLDASVLSVADAVGPMAGGSLAAWLGLRAPFLAAAVAFGVGGIATLRLLPRSQQSDDV